MKSGLKKNKINAGFGLLEAVVGASVMSFCVFSLMLVMQTANKIMIDSTRVAQSSFLLEEGLEAARILRDFSWQNNIASLSTTTDYYFSFDNSAWKATTTNSYIDGVFERKLNIFDAYRDADDDLSPSGGGGTYDPGTKKVIIYVSWLSRSGTTTKSLSTYITNLFGN